VYFECVWLLYCLFFDCVLVLFVIKYFTKYTLCCRTHLTTLSHLLAVGGVTDSEGSGGDGVTGATVAV